MAVTVVDPGRSRFLASPSGSCQRAGDAGPASRRADREQPPAGRCAAARAVLLALIVAPALKVATGGLHSPIDYQSFVGVGAVGLVIPLSCIFAGLSVIVDRQAGAQRELLAAPVPRAYLVLGNLVVAVVLSTLQAVVLVG